MKTIAIVSEDLSSPLDEGFKKTSASLAVSIANLGTRVTIFTRKSQGLPLAAQPLPGNKLLLGWAFACALRQAEPDAVLYMPQSAATPMSLVRAHFLKMQSGGKPVAVLSLQGREYSGLVRLLLRMIGPSLVLVLSRHSQGVMRSAHLTAKIVPLGVDALVFRPPDPGEKRSLRQKYGIPEGKVILHVGHISPRRNLSLLKRLLKPGRQLVVVSSTSTRQYPEVKQALEGLPVIFLERFIEKIEEVYQLADCYVFPTFSHFGAIEIPLSVLEAAATNLPVVTTDFGGIPDLFQGGKELEHSGLLIARSESEFAEKMEYALMLADVATRNLVLDLSWDRVARRIVEAIQEIIEVRSSKN